MDVYTFSLGLGASGLGVMALGGLARHGAAGRGGHGVSHGGHGAPAVGGHAHGGVGHAHGNLGHAHDAAWVHTQLAWLASPRVWFGVALGLGAAGSLAREWLGGAPPSHSRASDPAAPLFFAALTVGLLFERYVLTTLWHLTLRFASQPALTLETAVAGDATAVTAFDADGHGIVQIVLDGQVVQVLGRLTPGSRRLGHRVRVGETLRVEDVDVQRNCCHVSLL